MIRNLNKLLKKPAVQTGHPPEDSNTSEETEQRPLSESFDENKETFHAIYKQCDDVVYRTFPFGGKRALVMYIKGLSDLHRLDEFVLSPLMEVSEDETEDLPALLEHKLPVSGVKKINTFTECVSSIAAGNPLLLVEGERCGYSLDMAKWERRAINEPIAEIGIRGPREAFTETLETSTSQLRRIIKSPALKIQFIKVGKYTSTTVVIAHIEGIADSTLIDELKARIQRIEIDGIIESEYIEEFIEDHPLSPFPQLLSTERPDVVCANLLEGRAAVLTEGSPFALIAPISFFSLMQTHEDYYEQFMMSTLIRWLRYVFLFIALLLPSLYVAVLTFHQEMVPEELLMTIASSREQIPFPAIIEAFLMEVAFEALREAGIRLPKQVGSAISIVGALVIGQAAVQAGLVSAPMVIVVAITGISSFMIPRYVAGFAFRMLRFPFLLLAGSLGLLGIVTGIIAMAIHLCSLRSLGEPYLAPIAPLQRKELKDVLWKAPVWMMDTRPRLTGQSNARRQAPNQSPSPDKGGETS